jgi:penicillin-binding protein 2
VDEYTEWGYVQTDEIGLSGLEATLEGELRGRSGYRATLVDVFGREVSTIGQPQPATPGHNVLLTVDLELQTAVEDALARGTRAAFSRAGVAIAMDPRNGAVLALVSLPSYDNNLFAEGISEEAYAALSEDPDHPLVNHGISGIYPPGSTFKIIPAAAALEEGVVTTQTLLGDGYELDRANDGVIWLPNRYFPWDRQQDQPFYCWVHDLGYGHGRINIVTALAESCDIFFYQLCGGYREFEGLGLEALDEYTLLFGLGRTTGIDLPAENRGLVPDAKWKRQTYGQSWVTGDTYNMAIGQGYVLATPLQMLNATAAIANGGYLFRPQLVHQITSADGEVLRGFSPDLIRELPVSHENLQVVRQGMFEAVNWQYGTATGAAVPGIVVAGKTGTAEFFVDRNEDGWPDRDAEGNLPTHAWFTAFAPYEDPQIALVVLIDGGGEGSKAAVPVAAEILKAYFGPEQTAEDRETGFAVQADTVATAESAEDKVDHDQ